MKRVFLVLTMILLGVGAVIVSGSPQADDVAAMYASYDLDWIVGEGEVVAYETTMQATDPTIEIDFGALFEAADEGELPPDTEAQLSELALTLPDSSALITLLTLNDSGNIDVRMIVHDVSETATSSGSDLESAMNDLMQTMVGTVQLRGELSPDGAITSFFLEQKQRNLLAMFFELPTRPVAVGDEWPLDVHCIAMGNGFIADYAERVNRVTFTKLAETPDGQPVAVLDYLIAEVVEGEFQMPLSNERSATDWTCSFIGRGEFLIEAGRWQRFTGEFSIHATGLMATDATQHFALVPTGDVPPDYLDLD